MSKITQQKKADKAKAAPKPITTDIEVVNHSHTEEYDDYNSWTDNNICGLKIVNKTGYGNITADFAVVPGDTLHLLYAEYGTGDSFGHSDGHISYIGIYKTYDKAVEAETLLRNLYEKQISPYRPEKNGLFGPQLYVYIKSETGKKEKYYQYGAAWTGHFETLDGFRITTLTVE